ncbi:MAG TPA: type II toxin-antitoxin system RelE/ParE family toxin [Methanosarcinaceae archaeon]|nr:type II toxin-antitoxin system RelE/ParE family toxin [Methanosarcinaceae archaeon]
MYSVIVSRTFQKQFHSLQEQLQQRIRNALKELEINPNQPRSGADIKPLKNTKPQKHRLRVGDHRIIYMIEENTVYVIEVFKRSKGY